ncbi:unnamed protein product [Dibothriocephalus latus]|uniref:Dynein light chain n=1 Tax=Dibothriocephalus latus TaxID=60516 RepID=A0A3P7PG14_DIBLA|nr:unnamed protein product [Dibothriocephalus latus]
MPSSSSSSSSSSSTTASFSTSLSHTAPTPAPAPAPCPLPPPKQEPKSAVPTTAIVKHFDMDEEVVKNATQTAVDLLEQKISLAQLAEKLKKTFDVLYGPRWHCVVGKPFAR